MRSDGVDNLDNDQVIAEKAKSIGKQHSHTGSASQTFLRVCLYHRFLYDSFFLINFCRFACTKLLKL